MYNLHYGGPICHTVQFNTKYDEECSLNQGIRGWGHEIVLQESENESSEMDVWRYYTYIESALNLYTLPFVVPVHQVLTVICNKNFFSFRVISNNNKYIEDWFYKNLKRNISNKCTSIQFPINYA